MANDLALRAVAIKGEMDISSDLTIDGTVTGSIAAPRHELTIGPRGRVEADVRAAAVIVHGQVKGNVTGNRLVRIGESGRVEGDVSTAQFAMEDGGYLRGRVDTPLPPSAARKG